MKADINRPQDYLVDHDRWEEFSQAVLTHCQWQNGGKPADWNPWDFTDAARPRLSKDKRIAIFRNADSPSIFYAAVSPEGGAVEARFRTWSEVVKFSETHTLFSWPSEPSPAPKLLDF